MIVELSAKIPLKLPDNLRKEIDDIIPDINNRYHVFTIPKSSGKRRIISAPDKNLKNVQSRVLKFLQKECNPQFAYNGSFGFVPYYGIVDSAIFHRRGLLRRYTTKDKYKVSYNKGKSIITESRKLMGRNIPFLSAGSRGSLALTTDRLNGIKNTKSSYIPNTIVRIDIQNAFTSIDYELIKTGLRFIYDFDDQNDCERLCKLSLKSFNAKKHNVIQGLPQGSPLSPFMLNIALHDFDKYVKALIADKIATRFKCHFKYSRYADDITISTNTKDAKKCIPIVYGVLKHFGLKPNYKKTRIMTVGTGLFVNGINIVNCSTHISVSRKYRKNVRAGIYNTIKLDRSTQEFKKNKKSILGKISHIYSIDPVHGSKLLAFGVDKGLFDKNTKLHGLTVDQALHKYSKTITQRKTIYK